MVLLFLRRYSNDAPSFVVVVSRPPWNGRLAGGEGIAGFYHLRWCVRVDAVFPDSNKEMGQCWEAPTSTSGYIKGIHFCTVQMGSLPHTPRAGPKASHSRLEERGE